MMKSLDAMPGELRGVVDQIVRALGVIHQAQASSIAAPLQDAPPKDADAELQDEEEEFPFEEFAECGPGAACLP